MGRRTPIILREKGIETKGKSAILLLNAESPPKDCRAKAKLYRNVRVGTSENMVPSSLSATVQIKPMFEYTKTETKPGIDLDQGSWTERTKESEFDEGLGWRRKGRSQKGKAWGNLLLKTVQDAFSTLKQPHL